MKQTVEDAAKEAAEDCYECQYDNSLEMRLVKEAFRQGAQWQSKQSPWIRVEDKYGCDTSDDCVVMTKNFEIFKAYFSSENKWMKSNGGYYDEVIDDVICWMPIPSFDEILEANRDVLERIKEKGD